jgi:predicted PurR-regulated permease PerM
MQFDMAALRQLLSRDLTDVFIRIGLIAFLVVMCMRIFSPFADLMLLAFILSVALYPLHLGFAKRLGGRNGLSATLLVVAGLLLIGVPTVMLGDSFAGHLQKAHNAFENNEIVIKKPDPSVAEWPLVGDRVYSAWSAAAEDLPGYVKQNKPRIETFTKKALSAAVNTAGALFLFLGALVIAGIFMAYGDQGRDAIGRILRRLTGPTRGPRLHVLSIATIRSVATGILGVAFIQALLIGVGFFIAGIPGAGVLALIVLLIGILQLPALIISLPAIAYIWWSGDGSNALNIFSTVYLLIAGMADNVLKPLLLGRGVDAPMPVVLLGALGGMVTGGIIGMFVGAVFLAVGYKIFMEWVDAPDTDPDAVTEQPETGDPVSPARE